LRCIALFDLQFQRLLLPRRIIAGKPDIADLADRAAGRNSFKAACPKDRRFERELWRQAHAHLFAARRLSGLVIENRKRAVVTAFNPVGARRKHKTAFTIEWDRKFAPALGLDMVEIAATHDFP